MLGKKNINDTAHARHAGKVSGCVPGNSDNNRNICPGTDNQLQPLSNMPNYNPFPICQRHQIPGPENEIQKRDFA
jgi:hypothetical protein